MKILITGASGMLGKALIFENRGRDSLWGTYLSNRLESDAISTFKVDVKDKHAILEETLKVHPDVIIHTAALTDVDFCEIERSLAYEVNVLGVKNLVDIAKILNSKFVFISTDFVFDGKKGEYTEEDPPNPINFYGFTKLKGEEFALGYENSLIIRTSIFGLNPLGNKSGIDSVIKKAKNGDLFYAPEDSFFSPISVNSLARIIYFLVNKNASGLYHIGSNERISKFEFYTILFEVFDLPLNQLLKISFKEYLKKRYAPRPRDVSLISLKTAENFHISLPNVRRDLEEIAKIKEEYIAFFGGNN